jgi:hypothetical protein
MGTRRACFLTIAFLRPLAAQPGAAALDEALTVLFGGGPRVA